MDGRILLVEDDSSLRASMAALLERSGLAIDSVGDGQSALARWRTEPYDLVMLDLMLPEVDGLEVCRRIRQDSNVPIVMVTALDATTDLVVGLELGADDYITKPFDAHELTARTKAVLRRAAGDTHSPVMTVGVLEIDPNAFRVTKNGEEVQLSATEFKLLVEMARHPGQVMTRQALLRRVWDYDYMGDSRMVDMAMKRLRLKVEDDPANPMLLTTVRGVGYRFDKP